MEKNANKMKLPTIDEMFTTQADRDSIGNIIKIPINNIDDFPNHPFNVTMDDELNKMVESIKEKGVITPTIVRPKENGRYEMVSGHRRKKASELLQLESLPCIVKDLTDDEATILMVDTNIQREKILPSEKAFAYKMRLEAEKHQGKKLDITLCQLGTKIRSDVLIAKQFEESARTIQRYIRLTNLIPELLELVDQEIIALTPAVEISFLEHDEQAVLLDVMQYFDCSPTTKQAKEIRDLSDKGIFEEDMVTNILKEKKPNQIERIQLDKNRFTKVLPKMDDDKIEDYIFQALKFYGRHLEHKKFLEEKGKMIDNVR